MKLYFSSYDKPSVHSESFSRKVLGRHLNADGFTLDLSRNKYGKPYLKNYPNTHYNISHTRNTIVCAVSDKPVGVDVEIVKPFNSRIADRFFLQNEQNYVFASERGRELRFAEIWTKKEAYIKCLGKGMVVPFDSFDVLSPARRPELYSLLYRKHLISVCCYADTQLPLRPFTGKAENRH